MFRNSWFIKMPVGNKKLSRNSGKQESDVEGKNIMLKAFQLGVVVRKGFCSYCLYKMDK